MVKLRKIPRRLKDIKDFVDDYVDFSDEPIEGLVPVGDQGLYATPDEPADPTDCVRWADSPFCGGNPLTSTPIDIEPKIIIGKCDIGVTLTPVFAFIRLPPVSFVYRKPECRTSESSPIEIVKDNDEKIQIHTGCGIYRISAVKYYVKKGYLGGYSNVYEDQSWTGVTGFAVRQITTYKKLGSGTYEKYSYEREGGIDIQSVDLSYEFDIWLIEFIDCFGNLCRFCNVSNTLDGSADSIGGPGLPHTFYYRGVEGLVTDDTLFITSSNELPNLRIVTENDDITPRKCPCQNYPPPPPKEICCMPQCCPPPNNDLLKVLIKKVNKLSEIVGVDRFPAEFPKRLTYPNAKGSEKVKDLVELLGFQIKQVDRAVGYLPQKIKVADTNPGLAGNQSVEVEIHSFADFCKEILQYVIDTEGDGDVTNNMLVRTLYEVGFIHQGVVQGNAMLDAIVEHHDFKHKWKKITVPFAFDPYAGQKGKVGQGFGEQKNSNDNKTEEAVEELLPKLLNNTEVDIRILVNDEKKSLNDLLQDIKRDTAMAAAAVAEESTPKRLEQLVAAAQLMLQVQSAIDRRNMRQAIIAGNLKTRKIKK